MNEEKVTKKKNKGKSFVKDFFAFIQKGNVVDLAVGIIVGGAFQKIVSSLVKDIIMPLLSLLGGKNLSEAKLVMREAVMVGEIIVKEEIALFWGSFVQAIIDFLIIALAIFVAIRAISIFRNTLDKHAKALAEKIKDKLQNDDEDNKEQKIEEK